MIAIACDHAALNFKKAVIAHLKERNIEVEDLGCYQADSVDYPDYALKAAQGVAAGKYEKGILICGTGIGMSIAANKVKGIRCAHLTDTFSAKATRLHNDANMMALGERTLGLGLALDIVDVFLDTPFSGEERHVRRIEKIRQIESSGGEL